MKRLLLRALAAAPLQRLPERRWQTRTLGTLTYALRTCHTPITGDLPRAGTWGDLVRSAR